ncbi:hypothetical protein TNIN_437481 [Trichonephila inaurata madagascariensis]|uniref:Endonuclease/exonuclease/phosphatase domain-containing protein n=1 Tax=Trichonephila inaurata madagascariensis TaxID=2747483 RepID=A0A8X6Y3B7_9ARAC|nr:hypothetical protein TNIN_437481 [Trichonephila inaurata madagascariensis]
MTSAIPCDIRLNATASGATDAPCPAVQGHADKCATRTSATASRAADAPCSAVRGHADKCATRTLNILQLNINGTQKKLDELSCILHENNIHIACLQETKLNQNLKLKVKGYTTIRKDRSDNPGGGLAFLVKTPTIKYEEITTSLETPELKHVLSTSCCQTSPKASSCSRTANLP